MNIKEAWARWEATAKRDAPYIIVMLFLLGALGYAANTAMNDEQVCNDRYRDFVIACFEATGHLPRNTNLSAFDYNFSIDNRMDGSYQLGADP